MTTLTDAATDFPSEHALRHRLRADGRESLAHMLVFPERGIAGFIYPSVRAGGAAKGRCTLFGPAIGEPVHEEVEGPAPENMDFDDWRMDGLRMAVVNTHQTVDLLWEGPRIRFEGRYEALHPPYAFSMHPKGNPPYYGDDRTEQHGRITAELAVDGSAQKLEGFMIRDHSWGPRVWGLNQHYKWFHAVTDACSIHFFEMQSFGRRELRGYLYRDGVMEHVAEVDCDYRFDQDMMQRWVQAKVVDRAGRKATVTGEAFANIQLEFDPKTYLNEAPLALDIDGRSGSGWCEFCWNQDYFNYAKQYVTQYG